MAQRSTRRSYDSTFKLKIVQVAESSSNRGAAKKYNVDAKCVRRWRKSKEQLLLLTSKHRCLSGAGRKLLTVKEYETVLEDD